MTCGITGFFTTQLICNWFIDFNRIESNLEHTQKHNKQTNRELHHSQSLFFDSKQQQNNNKRNGRKQQQGERHIKSNDSVNQQQNGWCNWIISCEWVE